jgi:3-methyl-2-oxobutanoate hydroxymethyltransferase
VLQGHDSTIPVTIADMAYHTACVSRASGDALVIADMPFMSYSDPAQAMLNATELMQAGAQMVKMEGGVWLSDSIHGLVERGIPVCAHLGLTPQSVNAFGGYRVQGRTPKEAKSILADAVEIQDAGASLLVLECIPAPLAADITRKLDIPVIGIGAGTAPHGQILVVNDLLGLSDFTPRFVDPVASLGQAFRRAGEEWVERVRGRRIGGGVYTPLDADVGGTPEGRPGRGETPEIGTGTESVRSGDPE